MPALTPAASMGLPWRYAMGLVNAKRDEMTRVNDAQAGHVRPGPADLVPSSDGFVHAPGYSAMLRMFTR